MSKKSTSEMEKKRGIYTPLTIIIKGFAHLPQKLPITTKHVKTMNQYVIYVLCKDAQT